MRRVACVLLAALALCAALPSPVPSGSSSVLEWTVADVSQWASTLPLPDAVAVAAALHRNDIDGQLLLQLTDDEVRSELAVRQPDALLAAIARLRTAAIAPAATSRPAAVPAARPTPMPAPAAPRAHAATGPEPMLPPALTPQQLRTTREWALVPQWDLHRTLYNPTPAATGPVDASALQFHALLFDPSHAADYRTGGPRDLLQPPQSNAHTAAREQQRQRAIRDAVSGLGSDVDVDADAPPLYVTSPPDLIDPPAAVGLPPWTTSAAHAQRLATLCAGYRADAVATDSAVASDPAPAPARRPAVSGYPLDTLNARLRAVDRLWGPAHAFVVRDAALLLDGGIATADGRVFTFERTCIAGGQCVVDALATLGLAQQLAGRAPYRTGTAAATHDPGVPDAAVEHALLSMSLARASWAAVAEAIAKWTRRATAAGDAATLQRGPLSNPIQSDWASKHLELYADALGDGDLELADSTCVRTVTAPHLIAVEGFMTGVNYHHWLLESLPNLLALLPALTDPHSPFRVALYRTRWTEQTLPLLGLSADAIRQRVLWLDDPCVVVTAQTLVFPTPLPLGVVSRAAAMIVRKHLLPARHTADALAFQLPPPHVTVVTVVLRRSGSSRAFDDEQTPQLLAAIRAQWPEPGARVIVFRDTAGPNGEPVLSVAQTVALFARSDVVIGAYGAGLTNAIFAPALARTLVIQFVPARTAGRLACGLTSIWTVATDLGMRVCTFSVDGGDFGRPFPPLPLSSFAAFLKRCVATPRAPLVTYHHS